MKKIILLALLTLTLSAEILIVKETSHMRQPATKVSFRDGQVSILKEKKGIFESGYRLSKFYSYKAYLSEQCGGRKYSIISANFGVRYYNNFVIDCKNK
jgi:hypothetical protein